jgi:hypothetical protein
MVFLLVHAPGHAGAAVAVDPDHHVIDASVQIAVAPVLGEEGVQVDQQVHRAGAYRGTLVSASGVRRVPMLSGDDASLVTIW